jgi:hypothetical protein
MRTVLLISAVGLVLLMSVGCDVPDRVTRLEKETQELKAEVAKDHAATSATADYDLQAKCSRDAKAFFNEGWRQDKNTVLLDYSNHYNKAMNKCFIFVENHYNLGINGSWVNDMQLWNVYENVKYGTFFEHHTNILLPEFKTIDEVTVCEVLEKKCKTIDEFNGLVWPYLNN